MATPSSWAERARLLCGLPVAVLVTIAALDSADKALLGASFPMLGEWVPSDGDIRMPCMRCMHHFHCYALTLIHFFFTSAAFGILEKTLGLHGELRRTMHQ